jgi:hypothetical protein
MGIDEELIGSSSSVRGQFAGRGPGNSSRISLQGKDVKSRKKDPNVLRSLQYFEAVTRYRSFKLVAKDLGVTESAVSHQMRRFNLLDRQTRSLDTDGRVQDPGEGQAPSLLDL